MQKIEKSSIKITILFDGAFWVGIFERYSDGCYSVAKHIFGNEPSNPELYDFLLQQGHKLKFTTPNEEEGVQAGKKNYKRLVREAKKEMNKQPTVTKAHMAIKKELEQHKQIKKHQTSDEKRSQLIARFQLKQEKKKQKHKGH